MLSFFAPKKRSVAASINLGRVPRIAKEIASRSGKRGLWLNWNLGNLGKLFWSRQRPAGLEPAVLRQSKVHSLSAWRGQWMILSDRVTRSHFLRLPRVDHAAPGKHWRHAVLNIGMHPEPPHVFRDAIFLAIAAAIGASCYYFWASHRDIVALTGRERTMAISVDIEKALGEFTYEAILDGVEYVPRFDPRNVIVQTIFRNLIENNEGELMCDGWDFEVRVVEDDQVNAFATYGGKLVVFTGLLDALETMKKQNEIEDVKAALTFIIAHEIGHAVCRHNAEGISWLPVHIPFFIFSSQSPLMDIMFRIYVALPFSRANEYEADYVGLILMAEAGEDLKEAPHVQLALDKRSDLTEWSGTHPTGSNRAKKMETVMDEIRKKHLKLRGLPQSFEYRQHLVEGFKHAIDLVEENLDPSEKKGFWIW